MKNFFIIGFGNVGFGAVIIWGRGDASGITIEECRIENGQTAIAFKNNDNRAESNIIKNVKNGISTGDLNNTASYFTKNNLILLSVKDAYGIFHSGGGLHEITNNIILFTNPSLLSAGGIYMLYGGKTLIKNNIIAGFNWNHFYQDPQQLDSAYIINNLFGYSDYNNPLGAILNISDGSRKVVKNNIIVRSSTGEGIEVRNFILNPDYNLYWDLGQKYDGNIVPGENEITANPMFVKDTIPNSQLDFDYHLQKYSPAIDAGDPTILDVDGTRSDIGPYGGPEGEKYTYQDLAPRPPVNLTADMDSIAITLSWNKNTEADFSYYRIYRDTVTGFTIDSTKLISSQADTFYVQLITDGVKRFVYKLTAVDSQGNASGPSEELIINITSTGEYPVSISDYILYQNYPNPFNPSTKIGYRLKERGYVKLMVYDIKGELVDVLVNDVKDAGYYEVEFYGKANDPFPGTEINVLTSGIYIYRIEVIGKGNIPRFVDMGKMILLK